MTTRLRHRGPDADGYFVDEHAGLGFRRLRIIDLEHGDQPLANEDGSLVMVCNGEIFNYQELRRELCGRGHRFSTRTDVEVLLHLYEDYGVELLRRIEGQFAFAIYDRPARRLFLARDHFGVAPLYYTWTGDTFLFASEIKALLEHTGVRRDVDLTALDQVFSFPGIVSPRSILKDVHSLPPGHYLVLADGQSQVREYWDLVYPEDDDRAATRPEAEHVEELRGALARSVRHRLQADVPVGYYLSGGLDSSLIAGLVGEMAMAPAPVAFSITFSDADISEDRYQRMMIERVGATHVGIRFDPAEIASRLWDVIYHSECPLKETYNTCSLALSAAVRTNHVTVVLTGEGADELFAGYVGYRFGGGRAAAASNEEAVLEDECRRLLWGDTALFYEKDYHALRDVKRSLYSAHLREQFAEFDCVHHEPVNRARLARRHPLHQRSYLDFKLRLCDHLVADHGDRMALANGIEARYPFLDRELVELAARVPPQLKLSGLTEKYILRRVAEPYVPRPIIDRQKFGFHAPGSPALLKHGLAWVDDLLSPDSIRQRGYFDPDTVCRLRRMYMDPGFHLSLPFEDDLLMVVLTFQMLAETFDLPSLN